MSSIEHQGHLYIVATPMGNLGDITHRACEILAAVDVIYAEDTRHSQHLLQHLGIRKPLRAMHAHNEAALVCEMLEALQQGKQLALISDAGTPLISDPGFALVRAAREVNLPVIPIPGPCALIAALMGAGLPCDSFLFHGFLPAKQQARLNSLQKLTAVTCTQIFYEAPHRIVDTIADCIQVFGENRPAVLARELTKRFEDFIGYTLGELQQYFAMHTDEIRGEMVLLLGGALDKTHDANQFADEVLRHYNILRQELPLKQAVKLTAQLNNISKNALYNWALAQES